MNNTSAKVCYVSTSTVLPATQKNRATRRIELNPMDFRPFRRLYAQLGLLFAQPKTTSESRESDQQEKHKIISNLKSSLSQTLDYFFPFAGRLRMTKNDDDGTLSFYINCNSAGVEFTHAAAEVTVADLLEPNYIPDIIDSFFTFDGTPNYEGVSLPLLSIQNIAKLKSKANSECGTIFSSLQAVSAHVWVAVTRARRLHPNQNVTYQFAINNRDRLDPPIHKGYFGNLVQVGTATVKAGELLEKGISFGASLLNLMVESCNNIEIQRYWESWVEKPTMPSTFDFASLTNLVVGGSTKFDLYTNDFR
ncbi:hypothetical protein C5167_026758 [Papaver somniferum]|nr:hypothetical protein C5167_026758 [Papaver somniferum]